MSLTTLFVMIMIFASMITGVLYILFGQITVRKLRKNPKTKDCLGIEFVSGWDVINVAQALAIPRSWSRKLEEKQFSLIYANSDLLFESTTKFDRFLANFFYWLLSVTGFFGGVLGFLHYFNFLPK